MCSTHTSTLKLLSEYKIVYKSVEFRQFPSVSSCKRDTFKEKLHLKKNYFLQLENSDILFSPYQTKVKRYRCESDNQEIDAQSLYCPLY